MGKRKDGIDTLAKLRQRCVVKDTQDPNCCWLWKGAERNGQACVWVIEGGKGRMVSGTKAARILAGLPCGPRTWTKCTVPNCCNPKHSDTGTYAEWGAFVKEHELWRGNMLAGALMRANGRRASKINMTIARDIRASTLPPLKETERVREVYGIEVSRTLVDNVRRQRRWAEPNPFAGLGA